jgi:hypothetical protein
MFFLFFSLILSALCGINYSKYDNMVDVTALLSVQNTCIAWSSTHYDSHLLLGVLLPSEWLKEFWGIWKVCATDFYWKKCRFEYHSAGNVAKTMQLILAWIWFVNHKKNTPHTHNETYFCAGTTLRMESEHLRDKATSYYHSTIYHRHLITLTFYQSD